MENPGIRLFGSPARTRVLLTIALLDESYPREVARISGVPLASTQRIINDLERQGILASRVSGTQRQIRLNQAYFAASDLRRLLLRLSLADEALVRAIESIRRCPRRAGKAL